MATDRTGSHRGEGPAFRSSRVFGLPGQPELSRSVPFLGAPRRLGRRRGERSSQERQQLTAIGVGEAVQHLVFDLRDESSGPPTGAPTLGRDRYLPGAPIAWTTSPLGQPRTFEFVDQLDHGAWIDAHVGAQLLLDSPFTRAEDVEQREQRGREAN
jgi:hypothetical protein